ncbi:pilin [Psychrobacter proteolyticus]|uniref:pilin n=1 Tax=Psychrobacter proteolyticus TaxID=147825 RepID=UPI0013B361C6|nr:prepilin-type N-terminal cleavage/methylation domain-containing protein [Psychrobacter proteolyticus]
MKPTSDRVLLIQAGYTLIEMLIVVTVIGILAAITIPIYQQYIQGAQLGSCLSEAKNYSNKVFYEINDQDNSTSPVAPVSSACQFITDATGWTSETQQKIVAVAKKPSNGRIECDVPNGSPCRVLP